MYLTNEDQVWIQDLAKKLKELGVKQKSYWYWVRGKGEKNYRLMDFSFPEGYQNLLAAGYILYSAFTVAEFGEILKEYNIDYWYSYPDFKLKLHKHSIPDASDKNEANARALMLIFIKENKIAKAN